MGMLQTKHRLHPEQYTEAYSSTRNLLLVVVEDNVLSTKNMPLRAIQPSGRELSYVFMASQVYVKLRTRNRIPPTCWGHFFGHSEY